MIRNIKTLALALLAMAAIGAIAASAAQAAAGEAHIALRQGAVITGHGENEVLSIGGAEIQCKTATFEGTAEGGFPQITTNDVTVTPTYQECEGFGGINVTVQMNGCKYTINGTAQLTAKAQIAGCTEGKKITIKSSICTITIGEQGELSHVTFTNHSEQAQEKAHLQDHVTISGFTYVRDGFFCPQGEATYEGTTTIKAYEDLGTKQVTLHEHQYTEHLCGTEVGILGT
jgi:opacity protein-like surface antigen